MNSPNDPFREDLRNGSEIGAHGIETVAALIQMETDRDAVQGILALDEYSRAAALYAAILMLRDHLGMG